MKTCIICNKNPVERHNGCSNRCFKCAWDWYNNSGLREAVQAVSKARRDGMLPDLKVCYIKCADCEKRATDYDHRDYEFPLLVTPVCRGCNVKRGPAIPRRSFVPTEAA